MSIFPISATWVTRTRLCPSLAIRPLVLGGKPYWVWSWSILAPVMTALFAWGIFANGRVDRLDHHGR